MLLVAFPDKGREVTGLLVALVMGLLTLLFPGAARAVQVTLTDDTYTSSSASQTATNFGASGILRLQDPALASTEQTVYLKFDLSTDRKSTRLNSSHVRISYAVFCLKKKKNIS